MHYRPRFPLALALLAMTCSAQAQQSTARPPLDPTLLPSLVTAFHLDTTTKAPVSLAPDGTLILSASGKDVLLPEHGSVLLAPPAPDKFEHARSLLVVNRQVVGEQSTLNGRNPSFRVDMTENNVGAKRVVVVGEDTFRKQIDLLTCTVHRAHGSTAPQAAFRLKDGKVLLAAPSTAKAVYVFLDHEYAGCLAGDLSAVSIDSHTLPVGDYHLTTLLETQSGELTAPLDGLVTIQPRFRITCSAQTKEYEVEKENLSVPVKVERLDPAVTKYKVVVDGIPVGESSEAACEMQAKLADVYTGLAELTVIGVDSAGNTLPSEVTPIKVQNYQLNTSGLSQQLHADLDQIAELDRQIEYWYTRAINERDIVTRSDSNKDTTSNIPTSQGIAQIATTHLLTTIIITPGKQAECFANCRKAIIERAQTRLEVGKIYKQMKRRKAAQTAFLRVVREVGANTGLGASAAGAMAEE